MAEPRARAGGIVQANQYEKLLYGDVNSMGTIAEQFATFLMSTLLRNEPANTERSGFVGDGCLVTVSSGLTMQVAAGVGFYSDTSESDANDMVYKPIVVATAFTSGLTLGAHDATNPRIDIICLAPATLAEDSQSRNVIDPGTGSSTSTSVNKRARNTYAVSVVAGTPGATPAAPSTPAGYLKLAECRVPASSGAVVVTDTRAVLQLTEGLETPPPTEYHQNWVLGTSTEMQVTASSPESMVLHIAAGTADVRGTRVVLRQATTVTLDAASGLNPRIDLVCVYEDGTFDSVAGVAAGVPEAPAVPANAAVLAQVGVNTSDTTISTANITDRRLRAPVTMDHVSGFVIPTATVGAEASETIEVTIQARNIDGTIYRGVVRYAVSFRDDYNVPVDDGDEYYLAVDTGTQIKPTNPSLSIPARPPALVVESDEAGLLILDAIDYATGVLRGVFLRVEPITVPGLCIYADLPFN